MMTVGRVMGHHRFRGSATTGQCLSHQVQLYMPRTDEFLSSHPPVRV
jgi:hypothetical protein